MIKITIKLFAKLKEDIGESKIELMLESPVKISTVLDTISNDFGVDLSNRKNYMYAKNLEYCEQSEMLQDKDELRNYSTSEWRVIIKNQEKISILN